MPDSVGIAFSKLLPSHIHMFKQMCLEGVDPIL